MSSDCLQTAIVGIKSRTSANFRDLLRTYLLELKIRFSVREWGFESLPGHHFFLPYPVLLADIFSKNCNYLFIYQEIFKDFCGISLNASVIQAFLYVLFQSIPSQFDILGRVVWEREPSHYYQIVYLQSARTLVILYMEKTQRIRNLVPP